MHFRYRQHDSTGFLHNKFNEQIRVSSCDDHAVIDEVKKGRVDCILVEPEDGFSMLGGIRSFVSEDLNLSQRDLRKWVLDGMNPDFEPNISSLADWSRSDDPDVTLIGMPSRNTRSRLKGLVLLPYQDSLSYRQYADPYGKPYRDFFYNVTYEGLYYAYTVLGARKFCLSHLARHKYGRDGFKPEIALCQAQAVRHFCDEHKGVEAVSFWEYGRAGNAVRYLEYFDSTFAQGAHRNISTWVEKRFGCDFVRVDWSN